jgi:hypothetical protein
MDFGQVFPLAPAAVKTQWLTWLFGGLLVFWVALFYFLQYTIKGAAAAKISLGGHALVAKGGLYGRDIPLAAVDALGARRIDSNRQDPKLLRRRTNGVGLPGLAAGWYKLADGEKALAFVTDKSRAVYVPTSLGYALVFSPADPEAFLDALRRATALPAS